MKVFNDTFSSCDRFSILAKAVNRSVPLIHENTSDLKFKNLKLPNGFWRNLEFNIFNIPICHYSKFLQN